LQCVGAGPSRARRPLLAGPSCPTRRSSDLMAVPDKRALLAHIQGQYERLQSGVRRRIEQGRARLRLLESRPVLARPGELLLEYRQRVDDAEERAGRAARDMLDQRERALAAAAGKLDALSPVATLARGYAVARRADTGQVVRRGGQVAAGDELLIRVVDAELTASVKAVAPAPELAADAAGG